MLYISLYIIHMIVGMESKWVVERSQIKDDIVPVRVTAGYWRFDGLAYPSGNGWLKRKIWLKGSKGGFGEHKGYRHLLELVNEFSL